MTQDNDQLVQVEQQISYTFRNRALLERSLTHRSAAHEKVQPGRENEVRHLHNEALEFVGDSVLGCVVTDALFERFPDATEGELTLMKHRLVSADTLVNVAERLKLSGYLRMGRGEEKTGGRRKRAVLADTVEAIIAAVFLDNGYGAAKTLVVNFLNQELQEITPAAAIDYKTTLQERLQAEGLEAPAYSVVETEGPPHKRTFHVEASWNGGTTRGSGTSIKAAEMMAAQIALKQFGGQDRASKSE